MVIGSNPFINGLNSWASLETFILENVEPGSILGDVRAERALPMQHNRGHRAKRALLMQSLHERPLLQPYGLQVVWYDGDE